MSFFPSSRAALLLATLLCVAWRPFVLSVHGQARPASSEPATAAQNLPVTGDLLQLMRGVFFPTSNMIFNVQSNDPAEKEQRLATRKAPAGNAAVDWNQWGGSLYSGWDDVEYAAVTLSEVSPLLLSPGRLCQNGKPVPVERADWKQFTEGMLQAARKSYEAAKKRDQAAVSESTNDLSAACQNCHQVYRRTLPRTAAPPGSAASLVLRCTAP